LPTFILRSIPASVAFEPRSKNKKKGDKRGFKGDGKLPAPRVVELLIRMAEVELNLSSA
jgi:hypothetical protein